MQNRMLRSVVVAALFLSVGHGVGETKQQGVPDQLRLATQLETGDEATKRETARRALGIPPTQRTPALLVSIARELSKVQQKLLDKGPAESAEARWAYYGDLVRLASESSDPLMIDPLIEAVDVGQPVVGALARFGNAAAPKLVAKVRSRTDPGFRVSGLWALQLLVEKTRDLTQASRREIVAMCVSHLSGRQHSAVVRRAIGLAGTLTDNAAAPLLSRIQRAESAAESGLFLVDASADFSLLRREAGIALAAVAKRKP